MTDKTDAKIHEEKELQSAICLIHEDPEMNTTTAQETLVAYKWFYKVATSHTISNSTYCIIFPSVQVTVLRSVFIST